MSEEKQIIIDGVDVSKCNIRFNQFEKNICELGNRKLGELHYLCSENPNCYFKQLKRLQEENEGLKSLNDFNVQKIEVLKEENEELKEKIESYICNANCYKYKEANQYRQVLEKIRNIAETPIITDKNRFDEIINKIDEVLNDRNKQNV